MMKTEKIKIPVLNVEIPQSLAWLIGVNLFWIAAGAAMVGAEQSMSNLEHTLEPIDTEDAQRWMHRAEGAKELFGFLAIACAIGIVYSTSRGTQAWNAERQESKKKETTPALVHQSA